MSALSDWNSLDSGVPRSIKQRVPLLYFLGFIFVLFIGILIFLYIVTRRANPVLLDVNGHPVTQSSGGSHR